MYFKCHESWHSIYSLMNIKKVCGDSIELFNIKKQLSICLVLFFITVFEYTRILF